MIGAVVRYCEGLAPPPADLQRLLHWRTFDVLPNAGGQRDQVAGELERMLEAGVLYDAWQIKLKQQKPFMSLPKPAQQTLRRMAAWLVENEPELTDWKIQRWAKLG